MKPVKRRMNPGARRMKITWMIMRRIKMMIDMIILVIKIQCNIKNVKLLCCQIFVLPLLIYLLTGVDSCSTVPSNSCMFNA